MAHAFRRHGDRIVTRLEPREVDVLRALVGDLLSLVDPATSANAITARLFPDPSLDAEAAAELRGMIEDDVREAKCATAHALLESLPDGGRVSLDEEMAEQWLRALNDLRLALGTAIGVTEESSYDDESDDPDLHVYDWLTFLQETLMGALSAGVGR